MFDFPSAFEIDLKLKIEHPQDSVKGGSLENERFWSKEIK
jgi:hypothetical protein